MSWQEIVRQLHALHIVIMPAWHDPSYDDEVVRLNERLHKMIGKNYAELSAATIAGCIQ